MTGQQRIKVSWLGRRHSSRTMCTIRWTGRCGYAGTWPTMRRARPAPALRTWAPPPPGMTATGRLATYAHRLCSIGLPTFESRRRICAGRRVLASATASGMWRFGRVPKSKGL